ncbi:hypothetical protein [Reyranella sp.]|uniref:hypothetical protein n=1 Tax=Reyranella sp. TaxID=1929291 RepID=UPI00121C2522|nr:hypothetical protein [Reyranella sp.]TAJ89743.1 MAG: hypothetical protein EPO50_05090 [Reyranella sp.]
MSKTANYALLPSESGLDFDNNGAAGAVTFTLPTAIVGLTYTFTAMELFDLVIDAPPGVLIYLGESVSTAGGTLTASAPGPAVRLKCRSATEWVAQFFAGSWTAA